MNFLSQINKYILYISVALNGVLVMYVTGIIPFFLYLSIIINLMLLWYSGVCVARNNYIEEDMIALLEQNEDFLENVEDIYSLEMYYGDEHLQKLIDHSRELINDFIEVQEKYFEAETTELKYDDKENTEEETAEEEE
jgi:hypothetical protein